MILASIAGLGCNVTSRCAKADIAPLSETPAYAVITSDYRTTAVGLINDKAECITEAWIDSGTTPAELTTTIGGDVVLPTHPLFGSTLSFIDRLGIDVVTSISIPSGTPIEQFRTHAPLEPTAGGFRSNPQDAWAVSSLQFWVTRYEPNFDSHADLRERGNDIAVMSRERNEIDSTIDFSPLNQSRNGETIYARPARMVPVANAVVVGLGGLSRDFMLAGDGMVALVSPVTGEVVGVPLENGVNCGDDVAQVPGSTDEVYVLCRGTTFVSNEVRRATTSINRLRVLSGSTLGAEITGTWLAKNHTGAPVPRSGMIPLTHRYVLVVAPGAVSPKIFDQLMAIDLETGTSSVVFRSEDAFSLGPGVFDASTHRVLIPDGVFGMHTFLIAGENTDNLSVTHESTKAISVCRKLPAREIRSLR